jgi:hypothetical protein
MNSEVVSLLSARTEELLGTYAGILDMPIDDYIASYLASDTAPGYRAVPASAAAWSHTITAHHGIKAMQEYHRLVLLRLLAHSHTEQKLATYLPESIQGLQVKHRNRVLRDITSRAPDYYTMENDLFAKDFALCRGKLIPCGAEHVDPYSGVPRRVLLQRNGARLFGGLRAIASAGGVRSWAESHWDRRLAPLFNASGYTEFYLRLAELLERLPTLRGLSSFGWWYDPKVSVISPRLSFLSEIPLRNGAALLRAGADSHATADALANSPERQEQNDRGAYQPAVYVLLWPRQAMLEWARTMRR